MTDSTTGGDDFTRLELAKTFREKRERRVVFDLSHNRSLSGALYENLGQVLGNIAHKFGIFKTVGDNEVDAIFHFAARLGVLSEANPWE